VLKEANAAFNVAIQALDSVKRNQADDTVVTGFNDQLQSLREKASALETKAESVNANCACHGASRSATRFASIAAASATSGGNRSV
jgi:hypothetical protein